MSKVQWSSLGEIADFRAGFGFPPNLQGRDAGDYPFAKVGDISKVARAGFPTIGSAAHYVDDSDLSKLKAKVLPAGSIVFAKIGEAIRQNFRAITSCPMLIDNNAMGMVPDKTKVDPWYLYYFMRTIDLYCLTDSTTVPALRKSKLETIPIPLPPLPEQKRIAAILDKADSIRRKRQEAVRLTEELLRSVYADKMKTSRAPEISICEMMEQGILLLHKDGNHGSQYPRVEEFGETGIPFLSASCFNDAGGLIESQVQFLNEKKANTLRIGWIKSGDVLLAHNATVGRVALYDGRYEKALIGTSLTAFRADNVKLKPEFLYCALRSWSFQNQLEKIMGQSTRNQVPITAQRALTISIPDIDLQDQIVNVQRKINAILYSSSAGINYSISLFDSLLHLDFKGA